MNRADVRAVEVDADGGAVAIGVGDLMDIADLGRDRLDIAWLQPVDVAEGAKAVADLEPLRQLRAAQNAHHAPDGMVVHRRRLARPPHEADHRETAPRVTMQQVLPVADGIRRRVVVGQPVVNGHETGDEALGHSQHLGLVLGPVEERGNLAHEIGETIEFWFRHDPVLRSSERW